MLRAITRRKGTEGIPPPKKILANLPLSPTKNWSFLIICPLPITFESLPFIDASTPIIPK